MASLVEHGPKYALFKKSVWSVVNQLKQQGNVWDKYALHERPAERVRRHRYDAESESWKEDLVLFKVSDGAFDEGAMRRCFRAKKNAFGHVIRFHALDWKRGSNYIVKEYKTPPDACRTGGPSTTSSGRARRASGPRTTTGAARRSPSR